MKYTSLNINERFVCVCVCVWNFKGYLWNTAQNSLHWKIHHLLFSLGGALPLWESVGMCCGFAPIFGIWSIFLPHKIWQYLTFCSDLVGSHFEAPHFQHVDGLYQNWLNVSFYSDLVELRAAHPYWFLPGVHLLTFLFSNSWNHHGPMKTYGLIDLGKDWIRQWLVACSAPHLMLTDHWFDP